MRRIKTHHDGHGLNDSIDITADERDAEKGGNASHYYTVDIPTLPAKEFPGFGIQFQHGPRGVECSKPGITEAVLYAMLIDRLEGFQAGPFACPENEDQLVHLRAALALTRKRADARAEQGVLGKNERHES